jgi:hypothetical protein
MRVRNITTCALGLAAALSFAASTMAAQDPSTDTTRLKTTSQKRINISKGEVVTRVDTVYQTRIDTVRVDNTIVRVDTVTIATPAPVLPVKIKGPVYWGAYAGTTWPWGNIDRVYTNGFHGGGVLGWDSQTMPIGLRLDAGMSQLGREETLVSSGSASAINVGSGTPLMFHLAGDLKVRPLNFGGWDLYALGGVNFNRYRGIALASSAGNSCDFTVRGDCYQNASTKWNSKVGFNFGAGIDFHIGSQDMFFETRYIAVSANSARSWTFPVSLGVRYF